MKRTRAEVEAAIVAAQQSRETIVDELDKLQQELQEMPEPTLFEQVTNEMNELQKVIFEQDKASITKIIKDKSSKVILCRENKITINPKSAHIRHWLVQQGFFVDYITIPVYCSCDGWDKDCKCDNTKRKDAWCISWPWEILQGITPSNEVWSVVMLRRKCRPRAVVLDVTTSDCELYFSEIEMA